MSAPARYIQAEPLSAHRLFRTTDIDIARKTVAGKFCSHDLIPGAGHKQFEVCHNYAEGQSLSLNYLRYGSDVTINPGELTGFYLVQVPLRGSAAVRNGRKTVDATKHTASVLNPTHDTRMTWKKGCEKLLMQIDRSALHNVAENLVGRHLPQPVVFDPEMILSSPALQKWKSAFLASVAVAQQGAAFSSNMHKYQSLFEEELITGLLLAQHNSISHMLGDDWSGACPGQIRRARNFIMEHLTEPITIAQIAQAVGVSIRSLQVGFKAEFGCTPMRFLSQHRLNQAHYLLLTSPADTLVSAIAFDAGFSHLGRFSIAYRNAFGKSPRETLLSGRIV